MGRGYLNNGQISAFIPVFSFDKSLAMGQTATRSHLRDVTKTESEKQTNAPLSFSFARRTTSRAITSVSCDVNSEEPASLVLLLFHYFAFYYYVFTL